METIAILYNIYNITMCNCTESTAHKRGMFRMLINRWGILWKPLRVPLPKCSRVVIVCMKLHNFILDNGNPVVPSAIELEDEPTGLKALPLSQRSRVAAPVKKQYLTTGRYSTSIESGDTRAMLSSFIAAREFVRPATSIARQEVLHDEADSD